MTAASSDSRAPVALWLTAALAVAAPTLLAWNVAPSSTFLNQALAFALWGWFVMAAGWQHALGRGVVARAAPLLLALALLLAAAAGSYIFGSLPGTLTLASVTTLAAAAVVVLAGAAAAASHAPGSRPQAFAAICFGLAIAALLGALIAIVQVFAPDLADGDWIASSGIPGRAVGNLRQPNHLSSVLLWGCVAAIALLELRHWRLALAAGAVTLMVFAVVLTASRTGLLSVLLLALWGAVDRRLAPRTRWLLLATPLLYALAWQGMSWWGQGGDHRFGGADRLAETDISGSRFGIWANTLTLIRAEPWLGVGWGEFNLAWSMTPFPGRPTAFFDHAHNLPLHLAAEIGVPLTLVVLALLLWALWRVAHAAVRAEAGAAAGDDAAAITLRCGGVIVAMIGLHSLLEYPLWYAYFLLPTAWVFGYALTAAASRSTQRPTPRPVASRAGSSALLLTGALMVGGAALSVIDYSRVSVIFSAPADARPLVERITAGQRSWLFGHHADYAAATTESDGSPELAPFRRATHFLLDTRLMQAWAEALHAAGRDDAARHVVARLREFRNPASAEFFAVCDIQATALACQPPQRVLGWRELTR